MNKAWHSFGNGLWQMMPSVFTLLLSLAVVRFFNAGIWGTVVSVIVIQQIANSVLSWGNKDFLQREMATNASAFNRAFSGLLRERFFGFLLFIPIAYFLKFVEPLNLVPLLLLVFGRFLQQSFDIIILREKRFSLAIVVEVIFLVFQILALLLMRRFNHTSLSELLMVFWIPAILKSIILAIVFRSYFDFRKSHHLFFPKSFFFAMLSISGLVHSKVDLVLVSKLLDAESLGKYQIITAFLWNIQSIAMYASGPYIHHFYRLNETAQLNYSVLLRRFGLVAVPVGVILMTVILRFAFQIAIGWQIIALSLVFSAMSFIYLPWIFQMNRQNREYRVLLINVLGTIALVGFILLIDYKYRLTLNYMLFIITTQQLLITVAAFLAGKNPKLCLQS